MLTSGVAAGDKDGKAERMNVMIRRQRRLSRRGVLVGAGVVMLAAPARFAIGQTAKLKLGLMLPYTGTYAQLGEAITDGLKLAIAETGGKLGGRDIEFAVVDDESSPPKGRRTPISWSPATRSIF
jgi:ABC-type branched-subunit amino acid transport system substrate-binding protein